MIVPPLDRLECGPGTVRGTGGAVKARDGADDLKHQRKVALKVLKPELAAIVGAERFLAEITTTANLTHPHILPLFDSGEADSFLFSQASMIALHVNTEEVEIA